MARHRVAVTGLGMVTALGPDVPTTWRRLVNGESGIGAITLFDATQYSTRVAAEVHVPHGDTGLAALPTEYCRRGVRLLLRAAREAYDDAQLAQADIPRDRIGVAAGTSVNYVSTRLTRRYLDLQMAAPPRIDLARVADLGLEPASNFYRRQGDLAAVAPAKALGLAGPTMVIDTACAASAYAIGDAFRAVQRGEVRAMIAGGGCALVSPFTILAFALLGALSTNPDPAFASRPFDRRRDGFVLGEGAALVVLERFDEARARGAHVYGEIVGYGTSMSAANLSDPSPGGAAEQQAMRLALADGGVAAEEIDYVAAHGTSTPKNDATETAAIKQVFGAHARRLMVSSNKAQIGHTISAAGGCNVIAALKAMQDGCAPPTINYREPDPQCDLDYVPNQARRRAIGAALVNAFAFGGQNAALTVRSA